MTEETIQKANAIQATITFLEGGIAQIKEGRSHTGIGSYAYGDPECDAALEAYLATILPGIMRNLEKAKREFAAL